MEQFWLPPVGVSLKSDKNNGYLHADLKHTYDIFLNISENEKDFRQKF